MLCARPAVPFFGPKDALPHRPTERQDAPRKSYGVPPQTCGTVILVLVREPRVSLTCRGLQKEIVVDGKQTLFGACERFSRADTILRSRACASFPRCAVPPDGILQPGLHRFRFSFQLPPNTPFSFKTPSVSGKSPNGNGKTSHGRASVQYRVSARTVEVPRGARASFPQGVETEFKTAPHTAMRVSAPAAPEYCPRGPPDFGHTTQHVRPAFPPCCCCSCCCCAHAHHHRSRACVSGGVVQAHSEPCCCCCCMKRAKLPAMDVTYRFSTPTMLYSAPGVGQQPVFAPGDVCNVEAVIKYVRCRCGPACGVPVTALIVCVVASQEHAFGPRRGKRSHFRRFHGEHGTARFRERLVSIAAAVYGRGCCLPGPLPSPCAVGTGTALCPSPRSPSRPRRTSAPGNRYVWSACRHLRSVCVCCTLLIACVVAWSRRRSPCGRRSRAPSCT